MQRWGMPFTVYILECCDNSLYTGHTDNLPARLAQHEKSVSGYVAKRRPFRLLGGVEFPTRIEALEAELRIKKWSRKKKLAFLSGDQASFLHYSKPKKDQRRLRRLGRVPLEKCEEG
jgi:putative endonuclease